MQLLAVLSPLLFASASASSFLAGDMEPPSIPLPRTPAPGFSGKAVLHDEFTQVSLSDYTDAGKWLVLFFYPFDYTFVCPTEIRYDKTTTKEAN